MKECLKCGATSSNDAQSHCPACGEKMVLRENIKYKKEHSEGLGMKIMFVILLLIVAGWLLKFFEFGISPTPQKSTRPRPTKAGEITSAERFISDVENYKPGIADKSGYSSEFWNFRFNADSDWTMSDDTELEKISADDFPPLKEFFKNQLSFTNLSDEFKVKCEDVWYSKTEMGYNCFADNKFYGYVYMNVFSMYDSRSVAEFVKKNINAREVALRNKAINIKRGTETIAKEPYEYVEYTTVTSEGNLVVHISSRGKDSMIMEIYSVYLEEDAQLLQNFKDSVTTY